MAKGGPMTGMISETGKDAQGSGAQRAQERFALLLAHVANLYCLGDSSSISDYEAQELATSTAYALGIIGASPQDAACVLDVQDPIALWHDAVSTLDARADAALNLWREVVTTMPPLHNVSLRDTLTSLGELRSRYDTRFAAHVVPCDIDYQLSKPVDPNLLGMDYIESWLAQLLEEARWIAQFDTASCERILERVCPDYRGLHVNLYDLLVPYERELVVSRKTQHRHVGDGLP